MPTKDFFRLCYRMPGYLRRQQIEGRFSFGCASHCLYLKSPRCYGILWTSLPAYQRSILILRRISRHVCRVSVAMAFCWLHYRMPGHLRRQKQIEVRFLFPCVGVPCVRIKVLCQHALIGPCINQAISKLF